MPKRVHIFGASGSGTTSLASTLAAKHGHRHLDTDAPVRLLELNRRTRPLIPLTASNRSR